MTLGSDFSRVYRALRLHAPPPGWTPRVTPHGTLVLERERVTVVVITGVRSVDEALTACRAYEQSRREEPTIKGAS